MSRLLIVVVAVAVCAVMVGAAQAGKIDLTAGAVIVSGPGLGNVALPVAITLNPNNDNQTGGTPADDNNITVPIKRFDKVGYIDIVFPTSDTDGVTEYVVFENIDNNTGISWSSFTMELGFGFDTSFTPSLAGDGLDFDAPGYDPAGSFFSDAFSNVAKSEDILTFSVGLHGSGSENYGFRIDVPDGLENFTIRQTPTPVPEPGALVLLGILGLAAVMMRRKLG